MYNSKLGPWLVTLAAIMWAVDAPFRKFLTQDLPSSTIVLMEHVIIGALVLIFLSKYLGELRKLRWKEWLSVAFIGLGGSALATIFFTQSFHYLNPTVAILLQKLQPLIAIGLAGVVLREKTSSNFWIWAFVAILGAYTVSFPAIKPTGLEWNANTLGVVLAVGAAFFWGGSTVFGRLVLDKISFQAMTGVRFLSALLFLILINLYQGNMQNVASATSKDWLFVGIISVLAGFVSLMVYYFGLRSTKASVATLCELAFPVAAVVVNWVFLDASLEWMQIVGGLVLLYAITNLTYINETDIKEKAVEA